MRNRVRMIVILILFAAIVSPVYCEPGDGPFLLLTPGVELPIADSAQYYSTGIGTDLVAVLPIKNIDFIEPLIGFGYRGTSIGESAFLSLINASAGFRTGFTVDDLFQVYLFGQGGYFLAVLHQIEDGLGDGVRVCAGTALDFAIAPGIRLGLNVAWESYLGLYDGITISLIGGLDFASLPVPRARVQAAPTIVQPARLAVANRDLQLIESNLRDIFPVLYKYYDANPIGSVLIQNTTEQPIQDIEITLDMETYIDNPKVSASVEELKPGEEQEIDLSVLFNEQILTITEGAKLSANINFRYRLGNEERSQDDTVTVETYDRNALRWDNDEKISSFITAKDEEIQRFSKNVAAAIRSEQVGAVSTNLQLGIAIFEAMRAHGMTYVVDPSSAYANLSGNPLVVDFVQFPRQTLDFRAGDCDDLTACYCALMESVGVQTAFITVPGHIYAAIALEMDQATANNAFYQPDDLIFSEDGVVWAPVEITMLDSHFVEAWTSGAKQWRENYFRDQAVLYPTRDAWSVYNPVAFNVSEVQITPLADVEISGRFSDGLNRFVKREIADRELQLKARIQSSQNDPRVINKLGVLYARYGLMEDAREQFQLSVDIGEYDLALVNLGNIHMLEGENEKAGEFFGRAAEVNPESKLAHLGIARVQHELENYGLVRSSYQKLLELDSQLALKYSYLSLRGTATERASSATELARQVEWGSDE